MLDQLKPGQNIRCTVTTAPRTEAGIDTIERLMRQEPSIKRGLRKAQRPRREATVDTLERMMRQDRDIRRGLRRAQRRRRQDMVVYNRGNRDWYKREECGKLVKVAKGSTWTMQYSLQIAPELKSLAKYLQIAPA